MKVFILLCCLVAVSFATATFESQWNHFKLSHGKSYENAEEETKRAEIFNQNLRKIEEHNKLYEQGLVSYKKGVNKFTDWTREEYVSYVTKNQPIELPQEESLTTFAHSANTELPSAVDWRKKNVVTLVKDQNSCDGWPFSATGALESHYAIKTGKLIPLSEQQLIDCVDTNRGCSFGGTPANSFVYAIRRGVTTEADYPYINTNGAYCNSRHKPVIAQPVSYRTIISGNETDLQIAVATAGPVSVGLDSMYFDDYKSGIFTGRCRSNRLNLYQYALVVGYDTDEKGQDYWIVKNSQGPTWGENGYIRLPRGQNKCGIATLASYPIF